MILNTLIASIFLCWIKETTPVPIQIIPSNQDGLGKVNPISPRNDASENTKDQDFEQFLASLNTPDSQDSNNGPTSNNFNPFGKETSMKDDNFKPDINHHDLDTFHNNGMDNSHTSDVYHGNDKDFHNSDKHRDKDHGHKDFSETMDTLHTSDMHHENSHLDDLHSHNTIHKDKSDMNNFHNEGDIHKTDYHNGLDKTNKDDRYESDLQKVFGTGEKDDTSDKDIERPLGLSQDGVDNHDEDETPVHFIGKMIGNIITTFKNLTGLGHRRHHLWSNSDDMDKERENMRNYMNPYQMGPRERRIGQTHEGKGDERKKMESGMGHLDGELGNMGQIGEHSHSMGNGMGAMTPGMGIPNSQFDNMNGGKGYKEFPNDKRTMGNMGYPGTSDGRNEWYGQNYYNEDPRNRFLEPQYQGGYYGPQNPWGYVGNVVYN